MSKGLSVAGATQGFENWLLDGAILRTLGTETRRVLVACWGRKPARHHHHPPFRTESEERQLRRYTIN